MKTNRSILFAKHLLLTFVMISVAMITHAQDIFDTKILHEIRINFPQTNWYDTLAQYYKDAENGNSKKFLPTNMTIDGHVLSKQAGIRFKGEYSYSGFPGKKKPFRVHFNKFTSGQDYQGIKKINLHNLAGDPSFLREYISYDLLRTAGLPASRTAFAKLYINDEYWGCYLIVEEPEDKLFMKDRFGNSSGNLFDASKTTRLNWKGNDPAAYTELKLQTDENPDSWKNLLRWIDLFNNDQSYDFQQKLSAQFNAENFYRALACDVFLNNWDSYSSNGRNFFLYDDPAAKLIHWVPWDYNLAMWNNDLALFPKDGNSAFAYKPLLWRIRGNEVLKQNYYRVFCELLNGVFKSYPVEEKTAAAVALIKNAVETDPNKFYSTEDFINNTSKEVRVQMLRDNVMKEVVLPGITTLFERRQRGLSLALKAEGYDCETGIKPAIPILATVFPNPTTGIFFIYIDQDKNAGTDISLKIYSSAGQLVQSEKRSLNNGKLTVNIERLSAGTYFTVIEVGGRRKVVKVVRQ